MTAEPPGYELFDEETGKYWCPFCEGRLLRIGDYAECLKCGEAFSRDGSGGWCS